MSTNTKGPGVWACLSYSDAEGARTFLIDVFGFVEGVTVRDEEGDKGIVHAELRWPEGGGVMYGSTAAMGDGARPQGLWVYVQTADPDAVCDRARAAGARIVREPYDATYGSRNVSIADPEDNLWTFGTYGGTDPL
ncbi:VOC family protein [Spiractinospora alimapuensis]|uniref:VOC family protein n=1 Tax=Spiractinospora alimapuensis TaxID=2820884 RepID=UPI001F222E70|nr:VOC family protein [Spiractinospora alimapuensis]QVQ52352.1 VOC family protein [Spiractinospora alimapuensis]